MIHAQTPLQGHTKIERRCWLARAGYYRHWQASAPRQEETGLRDEVQRLSLAERFYGYRRPTVLLKLGLDGEPQAGGADPAGGQPCYACPRRRSGRRAAPVTRRSGKRCTVMRRLACNKPLADALYNMARAAISADPPSRACYKALRKRGHRHARVLRDAVKVGLLATALARRAAALTAASTAPR